MEDYEPKRTFFHSDISNPMRSLKRMKTTELRFKGKGGYFKLQEVKITENSGYALFKSEKEEAYFAVMGSKGRRMVTKELVSTILREVFWVSIIDLS